LPSMIYFSGWLESHDDNWLYVFLTLGLLYFILSILTTTVKGNVSAKSAGEA